jgi:hypothetical protein
MILALDFQNKNATISIACFYTLLEVFRPYPHLANCSTHDLG